MNTGKELFPHLLSPGRIGNLELKNRVVMAPRRRCTPPPTAR